MGRQETRHFREPGRAGPSDSSTAVPVTVLEVGEPHIHPETVWCPALCFFSASFSFCFSVDPLDLGPLGEL